MRTLIIIASLFIIMSVAAQNGQKSEPKTAVPYGVVKVDGDQSDWMKPEVDNNPVQGNEHVSFTTTSDGINIMIISGENKIQLIALTGQTLLNGNLSHGRFFIPARKGIYILKINGKSYKVVCK